MTFFNVISGLFFVGAVQQLLLAIAGGNAMSVVMASLLATMVSTDTLYTSWAVEHDNLKYTIPLMYIDLFSFVLLSIAIITLGPSTNIFSADVSHSLLGQLPAGSFWVVIGGYSMLIMWWMRRAGRSLPKHIRVIAWLVTALSFATGGLSATFSGIAFWSGAAVLALYCLYVVLGVAHWKSKTATSTPPSPDSAPQPHT